MDKEIKKENSAIEKAEAIANAEYATIIDPMQGLSINGGFVEPQAAPILPPVQVKKQSRGNKKVKRDRVTAEKDATVRLKAEKNQEKAKLKKLKAEKRAEHTAKTNEYNINNNKYN